MAKIFKCQHCDAYTLAKECAKCKAQTVTVEPAKYSPDDKYARYRRKYKRAQEG